MKKLKLVVLFSAMVIASTFAFAKTKVPMKKTVKTFVLVHGAWQAPYAWNFVKAQLEAKGQKVIVVELPGHGNDTTPPSAISLDLYRDKIIEAIKGTQGKVILVGHSFGGMSISGVAEAIPERIEKLIYIAAFVPASGQSALQLVSTDRNSLLGPNLVPSADHLTIDVKRENVIAVFCADGSEAVQKTILANFKAEPAIPFTNSFVLTDAKFGSVPKYYIHTLQDHNLTIDLQNQMADAAGIKNVYSLDSSHCPFLSMPDKVTALLLQIAAN